MNRIAGYSSYEKNPPDYNQALAYMEKLFATVEPERIIQKDYHYLARILLRKNQDYPKLLDELHSMELQMEKLKSNFAIATKAEKTKLQPGIDELAKKITDLGNRVADANKDIDRAFQTYDKALSLKPEDKNLINEIANNYAIYRRYEGAARMWSKLLDPSKDNTADLMRIGRSYYNGGNLHAADSVFTSITAQNPDYIPAYLWIARAYSRMDPDTRQGLAKPKFEKLVDVAMKDSLKNQSEMMEAFGYLSYFHMMKENYSTAKDYYNRMINLDPSNNENKIRGFFGLGGIEMQSVIHEKTNEGRLPYLARATDSYNKVLAIDPSNASAKSQLNYIREFQAQVKKGINPNEIRGTIRDEAGQPLPYASIRVKDTAAENLTNTKGEYRFEIPQGSEVLIVSLKGYKTVEIPITQSRVYNVTLEQ
jgi:tetratricopeptide (TPR) repeat protein